MVSEQVLKSSFRNVKKDIAMIHSQLLELSSQQAEIFRMLQELRGMEFELEHNLKKVKNPKKVVKKKSRKR